MGTPSDPSIVICGGGLAGLCLARQLVLDGRAASQIVVLDKLTAPLPEAAKVGESMFETGTHYLADVLGLRPYLAERQITKMGMRFFFRGAATRFEDRPELGLRTFPESFQTFQMERGSLENHLRSLVREVGVRLEEGASVTDVELSPDDRPHRVQYQDASRALRSVEARWVIDATGRRRLLQKKLSLGKPLPGHSAAWFYARPWVSVEAFVSESNRAWHDRVPGGNRVYSTTQLCGDGYWVWLIALPGDVMSIGIVAREDIHDFGGFATQERAMRWLEKLEPELALALKSRAVDGFRTARNYSYSSSRIFSHRRWACVGEAAVFADPLLANGVDLIGIANLIVGTLIELDRAGELDEATVDAVNRFALTFCDGVTPILQHVYPYLGRDLVAVCRMLWNFLCGWMLTGPLIFDRQLLATTILGEMMRATARAHALNQKMFQIFDAWATRSTRRNTFELIDYFELPFIKQTRLRHVQASCDGPELLDKFRIGTQTMEELAQAIFLLAVEDVLPEHFEEVRSRGWLNSSAMSLQPECWEKAGLFRPRTAPLDVAGVYGPLRAMLRL